jgi:hypothetical protein
MLAEAEAEAELRARLLAEEAAKRARRAADGDGKPSPRRATAGIWTLAASARCAPVGLLLGLVRGHRIIGAR